MSEIFANLLEKIIELKKEKNDKDLLLQAVAELLRSEVDHYDWVGFYLLNEETQVLELGPYVGKPTEHTHIPVGKGICGQVAASKKSMIVQDVSQQTNYIACSMDVQSEIVVPILKKDRFVAEIDIDSHAYAPFTDEDEQFLSAVAAELISCF
ncbi:MAG: GAF domain-containing protein [Marinilabiliales bacterium]|nr:GAF domain-containing protein [Marinilabiliales bacterium]